MASYVRLAHSRTQGALAQTPIRPAPNPGKA
jgi:hypothetical protein